MMKQSHWGKRVRWGRLLALLGLLTYACFSWPTYQPPSRPKLRLRLNYLERVIAEGAAPTTAMGKLTALNPEWGLFTLSFSTYALANLAAQQPELRAEAARTMRQAVAAALTAPMQQPYYGLGDDRLAGYVLPGSVLYLGHLNLMLGCLRQLEPDTPYRPLHDSLSARLYRRLGASPAGNLASYPHRYWVPDNTVALASLALHSSLTFCPRRCGPPRPRSSRFRRSGSRCAAPGWGQTTW